MISKHTMAALFLFVIAPTAHAQTADTARTQITAAYVRMNSAMVRRDPKGVLAMMTPDSVQVTDKGKSVGGAQLRRAIISVFARIQSAQARTTVQRVTLQGNAATAFVRSLVTLKFINRKTKAIHTVETDETAQDTWVKSAGGWRLKRSQAMHSRQIVDGKVIGGDSNDR